MGRQSARIYYNGKDHKDVYYNGKFHNAMYMKEQGGIIWQKIGGGEYDGDVCFSMTNTNTNDAIIYDIGINLIYPNQKKIVSEKKYTHDYYYHTGEIFTNIITGRGRCYGILNNGTSTKDFFKLIWVSDNGRYWKKIEVTLKVSYIYPTDNGFVYLSTNGFFYNVLLDSKNNIISEELISLDFKYLASQVKMTSNYATSINGAWGKNNDSNVYFLNYFGSIISKDLKEVIPECHNWNEISFFTSDNKSYVYGRINSFIDGNQVTQAVLLSCDGFFIEVKILGNMFAYNYFPLYNVIYENGVFYGNATDMNKKQCYKTSDFENFELVSTWNNGEYIELSVIGGSFNGRDKIRLYMSGYLENIEHGEDYYSIEYETSVYYTPKENISQSPLFLNGVLKRADAQIFQRGISGVSGTQVVVYLDSIDFNKATSGFAYFTKNVGVGISYP